MNVAERKQATAPAEAQRWLESFEAALSARDAAAAAGLFLDDGLWRDVLAFTWNIQTMAGRPAIEATLRETLSRAQARNFHIPDKRTPPRWISRAGDENIEALFEFETAFGPCAGVLRLKPDEPGQAARLDSEYESAGAQRLRRRIQAARRARIRRATSARRTGPIV